MGILDSQPLPLLPSSPILSNPDFSVSKTLSWSRARNSLLPFGGSHRLLFQDTIFSCCREFLDNLRDRLQEWSPVQCVGEIFIKFGRQLNTYTNFFNNYPVVLKTIEKVSGCVISMLTLHNPKDWGKWARELLSCFLSGLLPCTWSFLMTGTWT